MKAFLLLFVLFGCQACGAEAKIDPELKVLLDHYLKFAPNSGKLDEVVSIEYGDLSADGEKGKCRIDYSRVGSYEYDKRRKVTIDREAKGHGPVALTAYHEFGHCLHDLPHTAGRSDIMNPERIAVDGYWTPETIDGALVAMFAGVSF